MLSVSANHTFLDESFTRDRARSPFVSAHFAGDANLSWLEEIARRARRPWLEVKHATVKEVLRSCDRDLTSSVHRGAGQAVIIIADERPFRSEIEQWLSNSCLGPRLRTAPESIRTKIQGLTDTHVDSMLLLHTPLPMVTEFLDGTDADGIAEMRSSLGKAHNIRIFAGRATSAFYELVDRDARLRAARRIVEERRFLFSGDFAAELLADTHSMARVFDEGNRKVVDAIGGMRTRAYEKLVYRGRLWVPSSPPVTVERNSRIDRFLQAADVAAGLARELYESDDGVRRVYGRFKAVVVNGCLVRK